MFTVRCARCGSSRNFVSRDGSGSATSSAASAARLPAIQIVRCFIVVLPLSFQWRSRLDAGPQCDHSNSTVYRAQANRPAAVPKPAAHFARTERTFEFQRQLGSEIAVEAAGFQL